MTVEQAAAETTAARPTPAESRLARLRDARLDPFWLAGVLFVLYALLSVNRFRRMAGMSWDLGIFEQAVRGYAHFGAPIAGLKGPGANILGDHFSPITALLGPLYRVFPSPVTLLVAQAALFALSAVPVTRAGAHLLGRGRGLAVGIAYGFSWGVQRAVDFDFHEICFAVPLIAFALEAVFRERWRPAMLWAAPLVFVKEDLGATAAAIGFVILLRTRKTEPRLVPWAMGLMAFGVLMCVVALGVVIPAFNSGGSYAYWSKIAEDPAASQGTIPPSTALRTLLWILLPTTALLALRSPLLLVAVPTLGWRFVSHDDHYWGTDWHYSAVLMPVVMLALVDALRSSGRSDQRWLRSFAANVPAAAAAAALALTTSLPLSDLTRGGTYEPGPRVEAVEKMLARIPDNATVEANVGPISRLTSRCTVYWVGDTDGIAPDYIAIDVLDGWVTDGVSYARQLHPTATYTYVDNSQGYMIMKRTSDAPKSG